MGEMSIVELSMTILGWSVIGLLAFRLYRIQEEKPKAWQIILLLFGGLFSFSVEFAQDGEIIRLAVLPLGVMILSFIFRQKKNQWAVYRKFAWLGFWGNYIFLFANLLTQPIHSTVYPTSDPNTYLATVSEPSLTIIHPSGIEKTITLERLELAIPTMTLQKDFPPLEWYYETENFEDAGPKRVSEKFPYILNGVLSKWGSGIRSVIYVERDGKGVLISTSKGQHYFRSEHVLFEEGVQP